MEFKEKPQKIWAIQTDEEVTADNLQKLLRTSFHGLGHTSELAQQRLQAAITTPRTSHERMYERSFIEVAHACGALAVIAYSPSYGNQPNEWLVEAFVGENLEPEIRTAPMLHTNIFGIDVDDFQHLEDMTDKWFPAE